MPRYTLLVDPEHVDEAADLVRDNQGSVFEKSQSKGTLSFQATPENARAICSQLPEATCTEEVLSPAS